MVGSSLGVIGDGMAGRSIACLCEARETSGDLWLGCLLPMPVGTLGKDGTEQEGHVLYAATAYFKRYVRGNAH